MSCALVPQECRPRQEHLLRKENKLLDEWIFKATLLKKDKQRKRKTEKKIDREKDRQIKRE